MKKFICAALFASTLSFESQADYMICLHNSNTGNSHYQSWVTSFPSGDTQSLTNAIDACSGNGGLMYFGAGDPMVNYP
ncbi:hypothetical protein OS175_00555 [Marinicella sp. S1101]|uniref:hypothetical protein n=1 Tax=Marinicella marina TaxID=2996016 RepID=UPI0022609873|nr:hypothetical protein [Marinicella marina]MCX7552352.1 hypothetical protein [Marinicella marina]MDJ1139227.1 hypothetical protein [Marinicella marina]